MNLRSILILLLSGWIGSTAWCQDSPEPLLPPVRSVPTAGGVAGRTGDASEDGMAYEEAPASDYFGCPGSGLYGWQATARFDYLLWLIDAEDPNLAIVSNNSALFPVALPVAGGNQTPASTFDDYVVSGGRFAVGYWTVEYDPVLQRRPFPVAGVEVVGIFLPEVSDSINGDFSPTIIRPFFDLNNRTASGYLVAAPGVAAGSLDGSAKVDMWGLEFNALRNVYSNGPGQFMRFDLLAGFRYLKYESGIEINSHTLYASNLAAVPALAALGLADNRIDVRDLFETENDYFGGQVGGTLRFINSLFMVNLNLKLGVGWNHQRIRINGHQIRTFAGGAQAVSVGGVLAQPSNIGNFSRNRLSFVPEGNLELVFPLGRQVTLTVGYTLLAWAELVRASEQIDPLVDVSQIANFPGVAAPTGLGRPGVPFRSDFIFVHGLNVGLGFVW